MIELRYLEHEFRERCFDGDQKENLTRTAAFGENTAEQGRKPAASERPGERLDRFFFLGNPCDELYHWPYYWLLRRFFAKGQPSKLLWSIFRWLKNS